MIELNRWLRVFMIGAVGATIALTGCDRLTGELALNKNATLPEMRTHCAGRYLIDLPVGFEQEPSSDVDLIYGLGKDFRRVKVALLRESGTQPTFDSLVNKRAAELAADYHFKSPSKTMLALLQRKSQTLALVRTYFSPRMLDLFKEEVFAERGPVVAVFKDDVGENERPEDIEANLLRVVESTSAMSSPDQAGRGTCLGPLLINAGQDGEFFYLSFKSKAAPDVVVHIDMNSMLAKSDGGLLNRWDSKAGLLAKLDFSSSTLRRGKVTIGGMAGEELLSKGKDNGKVVRGFSAETVLLKPATFAAPSLAISMSMGGQNEAADYVDPSWTDEEAMKIWDAIVKSIRARPGSA